MMKKIILIVYKFRFGRPLYKGEIEENTPPGDLIVSLDAKDDDPGMYGELQFEILGRANKEFFKIDEKGQCNVN